METNSEVELTSIKAISENGQVIEPSDKSEVMTNSTNSSEVVILKPGSKIRPQLEEVDAIRLAESLYGISTDKISELVSYDDRNFLIHADINIKNPIIPTVWPHGYVLKIVNSFDTKKEKFFDAQTQMMLFLRQQGIECPKPVMNVFGRYHSVQKIGGVQHLVRLLEFLPGEIFAHVPNKTHYLFYQVGEMAGRIDVALKRFTHDAYDSHKTLWMLDQLPELNRFLYAVEDVKRQTLVQQIINEFQQNILSQLDKYAKGIIHGDFNEQNIIVSKVNDSAEYRIAGLIDFGDTSYSPYIFELAITIAYMILQSDDLETAGYIIAGYEMIRPISKKERKALKVCVAARLCQSLVMGAYSYTLDPGNEYLLVTSKIGWSVLTKLWEAADIEETWFNIADNYLKQSVK